MGKQEQAKNPNNYQPPKQQKQDLVKHPPTGQFSPAGRFISAVANNMLDLVVELFEPEFATAVVKPGLSWKFANSTFNTTRNPRTGETSGMSPKQVKPGDTALAIA